MKIKFVENMKLSRVAAYRKMTIDAAVLNGTSNIEGSVEIGKYADFAVLSENPFMKLRICLMNLFR